MKNRVRLFLLALALTTPLYATLQGPFQNDWGDMGGGLSSTCRISSCQTTCTGPTGVECCCFYQCPSGSTWVCKSGYCSNSSGGCL